MKNSHVFISLVFAALTLAGCGTVDCWSCRWDSALPPTADSSVTADVASADATPSNDGAVADATPVRDAAADATPTDATPAADATPAPDSAIPTVCTPGQVDWDCQPELVALCGTRASSRVCAQNGLYSVCLVNTRCFSRDAGTPPATDAGRPAVDAGTPVVDAGTPVVDAGMPVVDAGNPVVDAGTPPPPPTDSGTPVVDAGTMMEAIFSVSPDPLYSWGIATDYAVRTAGWSAIVCENTHTTTPEVVPAGRRCTFNDRLITDPSTGQPIFVVGFRSPYHTSGTGDLASVWYTGGQCVNTAGVTVTLRVLGAGTRTLRPVELAGPLCRHTYTP